MTISRMQNPQQLQGIGSLRQPYGLGKLVKKAFRGIKKVAKSPLGKAAILGGLGMYGMGAGPFSGGKFGAGFLKNMGGGGIGKFLKGGLKYLNPMSGAFGAGNKWKHGLGLAGLGMMAAPFIQKKLGWGPYQDDDEEPEQDWSVTPGSISNIVSMARARDPSLDFLPSSAYTQAGFYNAADGGRVGLLNGGGAGETQREQMLRAEYIKYRNQGGTMPYEQFKILVMQQSEQGQMPNQMMADGGRIGFQQGGWHPGVGRDEQGYMTSPPNNNNPVVVDTPVNNTNPVDGMVNNNLITDTPALTGFQKFKNFISGGANIRNIDKLQEHNEDIAAQTTDKPGFDPNDSSTWEFRSGGRAGYQGGELVEQQTDLIEGPQGGEEFQETVVEGQEQPSREQLEALAMEIFQIPLEELDEQQLLVVYQEAMQGQPMEEAVQEEDVQFAANGGRIRYQYGGDDDDDDILNQRKAMSMYRTRRQEGGLMDLGGQEKDYREEAPIVNISLIIPPTPVAAPS